MKPAGDLLLLVGEIEARNGPIGSDKMGTTQVLLGFRAEPGDIVHASNIARVIGTKSPLVGGFHYEVVLINHRSKVVFLVIWVQREAAPVPTCARADLALYEMVGAGDECTRGFTNVDAGNLLAVGGQKVIRRKHFGHFAPGSRDKFRANVVTHSEYHIRCNFGGCGVCTPQLVVKMIELVLGINISLAES